MWGRARCCWCGGRVSGRGEEEGEEEESRGKKRTVWGGGGQVEDEG